MSGYRDDIEKYLKGELSPAERNALERKALYDPFLADALEGAEQITPNDFVADISSLQSKIGSKKPVTTWMWPARIAASLAIVATASFIVWIVMQPEETGSNVALQNKPAPAATPATDSISPSTTQTAPAAEKPLATGPTSISGDVATKSARSSSNDSKPAPTPEEALLENEPLVEAIAADVDQAKAGAGKADEIPVTESVAAADKYDAEIAKGKAEDDVTERSVVRRAEKKKAAAAESVKDAPSPSYNNQQSVPTSLNFVSGQVTSAEDGTPLPGVNVVVKGTSNGTVTDEKGNYLIEVEKDKSLVYSFIGLSSKEVSIADQNAINVKMSADVTQLSEVVVTGSGVKSSGVALTPTFELAHPENGTRAFKQYLEKNIRYPDQAKINKVEGRVTIQFTVESDGSLTNFVVLKGIGSGCDEELIRLVKEGPRWIPAKLDGTVVQDKAKVRLKFVLP